MREKMQGKEVKVVQKKTEGLVHWFVGVLVCSDSREVIVTVGVHAIVSVLCGQILRL